MLRIAIMVVALSLMTTVAAQKTHRVRPVRNRIPVIQSFTASQTQIHTCPFAHSSSCPESAEMVVLQVKASDPENQELSYRYSVTSGVISGEGPSVNWNLSGLRFGMQTATVEVGDPLGGRAFTSTRVDVTACLGCEMFFICPVITVSCPAFTTEGETILFESQVSPIYGDPKVIYLWSHSHGERLPAQQGPTLSINAVGRPGQVITATIQLLGLDPSCSRSASCSTTITKRP